MTEIVINKCPCCGSENNVPFLKELKKHFSLSGNFEYGTPSVMVEDVEPYWYYICTDCGTIYASAEKLKQLEKRAFNKRVKDLARECGICVEI